MSKKPGRPSAFREEYIEEAKHFLAQGKSIIQLAKHFDVTRSTIYEWANVHPLFSDTLKQGQELSQAVWEEKLVEMMYDKNVNAPLVKLYFANRFGWHDKQQTETTGQQQITVNIENPFEPETD